MDGGTFSLPFVRSFENRARRTVEQSPDQDERERVLLSWIEDLKETTLNVLLWIGLEVDKVEDEGGEEGREKEEDEAEPVLEADDAGYGTGEAGRDELYIVYGVAVGEDVRSVQPSLLLVVGG